MPTLNDYFRYAETAFAAYANGLTAGQGNAAQYQAADMAPDQAQRFDASWQVLAQQDLSDGFSVVLFQHASTGEKVLAIRGTEASHWRIDYLADVVNIALLGTNVGAPQYDSLEAFYQLLIDSGKLTASEQVTVTGHSLGGFLAQAFTAMHDPVVSATYTYNSPGFSVAPGFVSNIGTQLLELFGITDATIPNDKIFNVRAVDGLSATAGLGQMLGSIQPVRIEPGDPIHNHSIATLADSLAVYDVFGRLDPSLSVDTISDLLLAASSDPGTTLENAVSAIAGIFGMPEVNEADRDALYERIFAIQEAVETATAEPSGVHYSVQSMVGSAFGAASLALAEGPAAGTALAYRYALRELNPFAVLVTDDSGAVDQAETQALYADNETALALYDENTGVGVITETYVQQRAAMLSNVLFLNREDQTSGEARGQIPVQYEDRESGIQIRIGSTGEPSRVLFGTDDPFVADELYGGERGDFLFGAAGNDTVLGLKGNDYLEGGADSDHLEGGDGADTLFGMSGNDSLYGGNLVGGQHLDDQDRDTLDGGLGADDFYAWNNDVILNPDASDRVYINGSETPLSLAPANIESIEGHPGLFRDRTSGIEFRWTDSNGDGARDNLEIFGSYVQVSGFENDDLGITLIDSAVPGPSSVFNGQEDYDNIYVYDPDEGSIYPDETHTYVVVDNKYGGGGDVRTYSDGALVAVYGLGGDDDITVDLIQNAPNVILDGGDGDDIIVADFYYYGGPRPEPSAGQITHGGYLFGGNGNDILDGSVGSDFMDGGNDDDTIYGYYGDDVVLAGSGNDHVEGHQGNDVLLGEDGSDQLLGGEGNDVVRGGADNDELYGGDGADTLFGEDGMDALFGQVGDDALEGGAGADELVGGVGVDVLSGGDDADRLFGQEDDDELSGGGGADFLYGDAGSDVLAGGTGDDQLAGDDGADILFGEDGIDILFGGADDDVLDGGTGADQLVGGDGLDVLSGGDDADILFGEAGNDQLSGGSGNDQLVAGDGSDVATADGGDDILFGDAGDDELRGGSDNDHLQGGLGLDSLYGDDGADVLLGEEDADSLFGEAGIDELQGGAGNDQLAGGADADELYGDDGDDVLSGDSGDDLIFGDAGADQLLGGDGADQLVGGVGDDVVEGDGANDSLYGEDGADALHGGSGDDDLIGSTGNDVYQFNPGDGWDRIFESSDTQGDRIVLGAGIAPSDVAIAQRGGGLTLFMSGGSDQLTIANWFSNTQTRVASVTFADGTVWTQAQIAAMPIRTYLGTAGNDVIFDGAGDDLVLGYAGDDSLSGTFGFNSLVGGAGSDTYNVGGGNNLISISAGDGNDTVVVGTSGYSTLAYSGVTAADVGYDRSGNNLVISRLGGEQTVVQDWFVGRTLDEIVFADGSTAPSNAAISEVAQNTSSNHTVVAGASTTVLEDWGGDDSVTFGDGIIPEQLTMLRQGVDLVVQRTDAGGATQDLLRVTNWFDGTNRQIEEFRFVSSPTVLTAVAITAPLLNPVGTDAADTFVSGIEYGETLTGRGGNDTLTGNGTGYTLLGGDGHDQLTGNGTGTVDGGSGNDTLVGVGASNTLLGGAGNDSIALVGTYQTVEGGTGNDTITGSGGFATYAFNPGDGQDVISANYGTLRLGYSFADTTITDDASGRLLTFARSSDSVRLNTSTTIVYTITGTDRNDTLTGNADAPEAIYGLAGDDVLLGGDTDSTTGGSRADELYGGDGNDVLDGGRAADKLEGGAGNDTLGGGVGSNDFLNGTGNSYRGGTGDDLLRATYTNDSFFYEVGDGRDTIIEGSAGGYSGPGDSVYFGVGIDSAQVSATRSGSDLLLQIGANGSITFQAWFSSSHNQVERFYFQVDGQSVQVLSNTDLTRIALTQIGTDGADTLIGDGLFGDTLYGEGGNDDLSGYGGADYLDGGTGDDVLRGGSGNDTYIFGIGHGRDLITDEPTGSNYDEVRFSADLSASDIAVGRQGNSLVLSIDGTSDALVIQDGLLANGTRVEGFVFADGSQLPTLDQMIPSVVNVNGTSGDDVLDGSDGYDNLYGFDGNDTLRGHADNDTLDGGAGNDTLVGGTGNDVLIGGAGDDRYVYASSDGYDTVQDAQGINILDFSGADAASAPVTVNWNGSANTLEFGFASGYVRIADGFASAERQLLVVADGSQINFVDWLAQRQEAGLVVTHLGSSAADEMTGSTGADSMNGDSGNDTLRGGGGNDSLYGVSGNDQLDGGTGNDVLYGGSGIDEYLFSRGHGLDTVSELSTTELNNIRFGNDVSLADLQITRSDADLIVLNTRSGDRVTVQNYEVKRNKVPLDLYVGSEFISATALAAQTDVLGTASANTLRGSSGANRLYGLAGNDTLDAKAGADLLYGGAGNDRLLGGAGADTYMLSQGWGADTVSETGTTDGAVDTLLFGEGILLGDLRFIRSGTSLAVTTDTGPDTLTIEGWYASTTSQIEQFRDMQGNVLSNAQVEQLVQASAAFSPMSTTSSSAKSASTPTYANGDWLAGAHFDFRRGTLTAPGDPVYWGAHAETRYCDLRALAHLGR